VAYFCGLCCVDLQDEADEAASRPDPEIKVFIRGADEATVDAAAEAILAVAEGKVRSRPFRVYECHIILTVRHGSSCST
jgi:hypothetical protein